MEGERRAFGLLLCSWSVLREQLEKCIKCDALLRIAELIFCDTISRWADLLVCSLLKSGVDEVKAKQKSQRKKQRNVVEKGK